MNSSETITIIKATQATRLKPSNVDGISHVEILQPDERFNLTWDRYIRLSAVANQVKEIVSKEGMEKCVLDVGGFDGALGLFLHDYNVEVIDPLTTGASGLQIPLQQMSRPIVVSIDALEHVKSEQRILFLKELSRITSHYCLLNFPNHNTMDAQKLAFSLTGNQFVKEHVEFVLPKYEEVMSQMEGFGFACKVIYHGDCAVWISQFVLQNISPEAAALTSRFLVNHLNSEENPSMPLYDLVICKRV